MLSYAFITFNISLCITPIKLIKSLLYYMSTLHQFNFTKVLLFKSAIYVFNVTSTEKFPELSKLHCLKEGRRCFVLAHLSRSGFPVLSPQEKVIFLAT